MKAKVSKHISILLTFLMLIPILPYQANSQEKSTNTVEISTQTQNAADFDAASVDLGNSQDSIVLEIPSDDETISETVANTVLTDIEVQEGYKFIRGIHLTVWMASIYKHRQAILNLLRNTELNAIVLDLKEYDGAVHISGAKLIGEYQTYANTFPDIANFLVKIREQDGYSIARIVAFRDNVLPRKKPALGVKNPDGSLWRDRNGVTWLDPYNEEAQEYILQIAEKAADLGFDEIQFDYIRFPSDGDMSKTRYSNKQHTGKAASEAIVDFLRKANERLKKKGVKISIDVFGLTTTAVDDMGIGQKIVEMAEYVDYVSPMVYPSHYAPGSYGAADPNKEPYRIVYTAMNGALKRIPVEKLRPWLQDFTMRNYPYRRDQVLAQIQACYDNDIGSWLLWNPRCVYTTSALRGPKAERTYEKRVRMRRK